MFIYLMRHGETDWNKRTCFQGQTDVPLNDYGRKLAEITSEALKEVAFEAVFCSPLIRAVETAQIMLRDRPLTLIKDERLKEISFGVKEGSNIEEMRNNPQEPFYYLLREPENYVPPEGAESLPQLYSRSASFMQERILPLEKEYEIILIVAHGAMNRSIVNPIAGIPMSDFWNIKMPNCTVSLLSLQSGRFDVVEKAKIYY